MVHPYRSLPQYCFWRTGVSAQGPFDIGDLYDPGFPITPDCLIVTAGSCFAQRVSQAIRARNYKWLETEPGPPMLSATSRRKFNYGIYSCRTGNIYTAAALRQWVDWAIDGLPKDLEIWTEPGGRVQDPFRPQIEPDGFENAQQLHRSREVTISAFHRALSEAKVFVFTLGLTEAWENRETGLVYPSCPGTLAGTFSESLHVMNNHGFARVYADLAAVLGRLKSLNPGLRTILTVSPVPLAATAERDRHVLVATTYSKSVLRAVAGEAARALPDVTYFPSYEVFSTPPFRGMFFDATMQNVDPHGVSHVMDMFFHAHEAPPNAKVRASQNNDETEQYEDLVCADYILNYYAPEASRR